MRIAWVMLGLAACGGSTDFELDPLPACPSCGPGHVRAGVVAHEAPSSAGISFERDGDLLVAIDGDQIEWLTPDLEVARRAAVPFDGAANGGPWIGRVLSAPDGTSFATVAGYPDDTGAEQVDLVALDAAGGARWRQTIFTHGGSSALSLAIASDGGLIVSASSPVDSPVLGGQQMPGARGVVGELDPATGSLRWSKPLAGDQGVVDSAPPIYAGGDRLAVGTINGNVDLGGPVGAVSGPGLLVARVDGAGTGAWARVLTSPGFVAGYSLAVAAGANDRVYVTTDFGQTLDLGDGTVLSPPPEGVDAHDVVIALDGNGAVAWTALASFNPTGGVAATARGAILGQSYDAAGEIGGAPLPTPDKSDGACAELVDRAAAWALMITGSGYQSCAPLGAIGGRSFVVIGSFGAADGSIQVHASFDGHEVDGDAVVLAEVATE